MLTGLRMLILSLSELEFLQTFVKLRTLAKNIVEVV